MTATNEPRDRKSASHGEAGYERRPGDFYPTEPWVTRALVRAVELGHRWGEADGRPRREVRVWEPACGDGRMAKEIAAAGYEVIASDRFDHGFGHTGIDFLDPRSNYLGQGVDAIVTNPPFEHTLSFVGRALDLTKAQRGRVAILQRFEWDAAVERHPLFSDAPFRCKLVLHKRPRWVDDKDGKPRFPFAWFFWDWSSPGPGPTIYLPDPDRPGLF